MISGLVSKLKSFKLLSDELSKTLDENFGHMTTALIRNESKNIEKTSGSRYSDEIREFATTLHFYSPRAYRIYGGFNVPKCFKQILLNKLLSCCVVSHRIVVIKLTISTICRDSPLYHDKLS